MELFFVCQKKKSFKIFSLVSQILHYYSAWMVHLVNIPNYGPDFFLTSFFLE